MPNIRGIVTIINNQLKATCFNNQRFQGANYSNLAYIIMETPEKENDVAIKRPMIVAQDGEGTDVGIDDNYPMIIYHRNTDLTYEDDQSESFGDLGVDIKETADMLLVCIGDRSTLKVVQEDVSAALWANIPRTLTPIKLTSIGSEKVIIEPLNVNVNPMDVWAQEIQGVQYPLGPEDFMLSVKYRITNIYNKNCFVLCN